MKVISASGDSRGRVMSQAISETSVSVCTITENCLVGAYLGQILGADRRFRLLNWGQFNRLSPTFRRDTVFVIEQCGLDTPLCECLKKLRGDCARAKFLVLDHHKSKEDILRLLLMGVQGYVAHADVSHSLFRAILFVASGQLWVPLEVFQEYLSEVSHILRKDHHHRQTTTPREDEILELVRKRLSNREIADMLKISVSTVKFHVSNIFSKLHASSRRELVDAPFRRLGRILTN